MSKEEAVGKAFEGLAVLIDDNAFWGEDLEAARRVLGRTGMLLAGRPEDTLYCKHYGRSIYFPRYGNHVCPICKKP